MEYSERLEHCQPSLWREVDVWRRRIAQHLFPPVCTLCRNAGRGELDLCAACEADLPVNTLACPRCAQPLAPQTSAVECGACLHRAPSFDAAFAAFRYAYPIAHLITGLKYRGETPRGRLLGVLLAQRLQASRSMPWPALLMPTPLSDRRYRRRGFNQAAEIARPVAQLLRIPLREDLLERIWDTQEQAGLDRKARRRNVRGAFAAKIALPGAHVAIVDDVITTGSTAHELAKVLRRAGAARVEVWAAARAD